MTGKAPNDDWTIPFAEDEDSEELDAALSAAFTNDSIEASKPHHAGHS